MEKIIEKFDEDKYSQPIEDALDWKIVGSNSDKEHSRVHKILKEIYTKGKLLNVGVVQGLEGGLTFDYINNKDSKEWRFILGFTELGYWVYCNCPKEDLSK